MTEQFANKIETTLAADYTAASGTCTVTSAAAMPASGTFRLRLANSAGTILRVDSRAGAVLTVTVEQDDGNAPAGTAVWHGPTAGAMAQLKTDAAAGAGGSGMPWWPTITAIVGADYAWINQGTASVTDANGVSYLVEPGTAAVNVRLRKKAQPATPYTITSLIMPDQLTTTNSEMGLMLRESATGKLFGLGPRDRDVLSTITYTSPTGAIGAPTTVTPTRPRDVIWLRITHDGTNLVSSYSVDGRNWIQIETRVKTTVFTTDSDEVGYFVNSRTAAPRVVMSVCSWVQT